MTTPHAVACLLPKLISPSMATYNVTAWQSAKDYTRTCTVDVLCLQETHLLDHKVADTWMRERGWQAIWTPAEPGNTKHTSWEEPALHADGVLGLSCFDFCPPGALVPGRATPTFEAKGR